jgi:RsiW-degrading membrane proteinase PrsW (M82 family)
MNGIPALFFLLLIALLPAIPLYIWFRVRRFGDIPFLLALGAGVLSVLIASLGHSFFTPLSEQDGIGALALGVFRISLVEELSRLLCLYLLFRFYPKRCQSPFWKKNLTTEFTEYHGEEQKRCQSPFLGAPSGLAAGLGFAAAEGIFYTLSNPGAALWRIFTRRIFAIALHAACGARIGNALSLVMGTDRKQTRAATFFVLTAIFVHAMYNFCILNPRVPTILAALLAVIFLASSLITMRVVTAR